MRIINSTEWWSSHRPIATRRPRQIKNIYETINSQNPYPTDVPPSRCVDVQVEVSPCWSLPDTGPAPLNGARLHLIDGFIEENIKKGLLKINFESNYNIMNIFLKLQTELKLKHHGIYIINIVERQGKLNVKTLHNPGAAEFSRHCVLSCETERCAFPHYQSEKNNI